MKKTLILLFIGFNTLMLLGQSRVNSPIGTPSIGTGSDKLVSSKTRYGLNAGGANSYEEALAGYEELNGSPFLYGKEIMVDIVLHNDSLLEQVPLLYDVFNNELIIQTKKEETLILDKAYYKGFNYKADGIEEQYRRVNPQKPFIFYKVLYRNDDFIFCAQAKATIRENDQIVPGQESLKKEFVRRKSHFIISNRKANKAKLRKGALITHLPEKYQLQVNDLKKKLKLKKLNKEKDYVRLMEEFKE